jgi:hypothetical protein
VSNIADLKHPKGVELCSKRCWDKLAAIKKRISYARVCVEVEASEELVKDFYLQCESLGIPLFRVLLQNKQCPLVSGFRLARRARRKLEERSVVVEEPSVWFGCFGLIFICLEDHNPVFWSYFHSM